MTTDTSKAPERIWASEVALFNSGRSAGSYYTDRYSSPAGNEYATEYVRADIHADMEARVENLEGIAKIDRVMDKQITDDVVRYKARAENAEAAIKYQARAAMVLRKITLDELEQLRAENALLREALKFYGDVSKYLSPLTGGLGDLYFDCGQIARAALERKEGT